MIELLDCVGLEMTARGKLYYFSNYLPYLPVNELHTCVHWCVTCFSEWNMGRYDIYHAWAEALGSIAWFTHATIFSLQQELHLLFEGTVDSLLTSALRGQLG